MTGNIYTAGTQLKDASRAILMDPALKLKSLSGTNPIQGRSHEAPKKFAACARVTTVNFRHDQRKFLEWICTATKTGL